ncbi:MAG: PadR family transcriptional regulator [Bradyrhizobium sp.]|jgi:DNA-binding PadR family transcriptional regulator|uniref:Helix-turn-helix transcriptional regulator n=2 Tax=Bradyrhizobium TaxID=374 RepID=A0ABS5G6S7_9BRAD|nr:MULTISPECIES: PadR family transcriptional regulator [Bradyrhizobium]MDU6255401.1 PadR family transcriptional regulator [Staphylococcus warneri]MBR1136958.1 helix-turn-helix transcriptional regulator [Bradyrhizobium denitrificans]MDU1492564.1 PadR family transcriptional regulator [Bradyrhizobium sp.]MDU1542901.1 PadR family transcriptional regulator [Bradyrhizobium sp.]MDU1665410.1 PadR family transcriptional regulator [Bradyrhizobium sp.]
MRHHWTFGRPGFDDDREVRGWGHRGHHPGHRHGQHRSDESCEEVRLGERGPGFGRHRGHGLFERDGRRGGRDEFGRGGGGRFFGPGDLRSLLLWLIGEKPRHGYELIKAVEQLVGGAYSPSPGSVYPILSLLEDMGQIEAAASEGGKKLFAITDAGRQALKDDAAAIEGLLNRMRIMARTMGGMRPPEPVLQAVQTLKMALKMHRPGWSDAEANRVSDILTRAIAEIQGDDEGTST